jgi:hypothetical protein
MNPGRRPSEAALFWSMTVNGPMAASTGVANVDEAKAQFQTN